jgi:NTE family protein
MIGDRDIETLDIGFTAVATEINEGREVWFNRGSLFEAIKASIAMPLIFAPVERDEQVLVDGGLINPVPVAPTLNAGTHRTIAVRLDGPTEEIDRDRDSEDERHKSGSGLVSDSESESESESESDNIRERIARFVDNLIPGKSNDEPESLNAIEIALQSIDTMQRTIAHMKLAVYGADLEVQLPENLCTFLEFHRARELIETGYRRTEAALKRAGADFV